MTHHKSRQEKSEPPPLDPPEPVNVIDGIPDRSPAPARWKTAVLLAVFVAWVVFLLVCLVVGSP